MFAGKQLMPYEWVAWVRYSRIREVGRGGTTVNESPLLSFVSSALPG